MIRLLINLNHIIYRFNNIYCFNYIIIFVQYIFLNLEIPLWQSSFIAHAVLVVPSADRRCWPKHAKFIHLFAFIAFSKMDRGLFLETNKGTNSVALSPQANYTD
jgi:hypothetical protein